MTLNISTKCAKHFFKILKMTCTIQTLVYTLCCNNYPMNSYIPCDVFFIDYPQLKVAVIKYYFILIQHISLIRTYVRTPVSYTHLTLPTTPYV